jgi:hypothetical protein
VHLITMTFSSPRMDCRQLGASYLHRSVGGKSCAILESEISLDPSLLAIALSRQHVVSFTRRPFFTPPPAPKKIPGTLSLRG